MSVIMWYIPHSCWISIGMRARRAGSSINFSSSSPFNYLSQWLHTLAALMILPPCFCPIMTGLWLFQHFPGTGLWQSFYRLFLSPAAFCMASYVCRRSCLAFELISLPRTKREVDRMTCCRDRPKLCGHSKFFFKIRGRSSVVKIHISYTGVIVCTSFAALGT